MSSKYIRLEKGVQIRCLDGHCSYDKPAEKHENRLLNDKRRRCLVACVPSMTMRALYLSNSALAKFFALKRRCIGRAHS